MIEGTAPLLQIGRAKFVRGSEARTGNVSQRRLISRCVQPYLQPHQHGDVKRLMATLLPYPSPCCNIQGFRWYNRRFINRGRLEYEWAYLTVSHFSRIVQMNDQQR